MIRHAERSDAKGIARVHVDSWKETYAGILPQEGLDDLGYRGRENIWKGLDPAFTFVDEEDGEIVGFVSVGRERSNDPTFSGELYAIYLLRSHQGRGIGQALFLAGARALRDAGHPALLLWVLSGNPARAFYERLGGVFLRSQPIQFFGAELTEDALGWTDIELLLT